MADPNWVAILFGFAGGSVASTLINLGLGRWSRPVIRACLVPRSGCYVETGRGNPRTHRAKFLRLQIKNSGRSSVKGCTGYITRLKKHQSGQTVNDAREVLALKWALSGGVNARDIPRGAFFYMDIAALDRVACKTIGRRSAPIFQQAWMGY